MVSSFLSLREAQKPLSFWQVLSQPQRHRLCARPHPPPPRSYRLARGAGPGAGANFRWCQVAGRQVLLLSCVRPATVNLPQAMAKLMVLTLLGLAVTFFRDQQSSYQ